MTDWVEWHADYDDPNSSLSRRIDVVRRRLRDTLESLCRPATVLSLCAGDGRDVIDVCRTLPRTAALERAVLVELDPELAARATMRSRGVSTVEVRCADAADPRSWADAAPADVLVLCGVLGNVAAESVPGVVHRLQEVVGDGGYVIWTRGGGAVDRRDEVRSTFTSQGFAEIEFDGSPEHFGVGVSRFVAPVAPLDLDRPIFEFVR